MCSRYARCEWGLKVKLMFLHKNNEAPFHIWAFPNARQNAQKTRTFPCFGIGLQMHITLAVQLNVNGTPNAGSRFVSAVQQTRTKKCGKKCATLCSKKSSGASLGHLSCIGQPVQLNGLLYVWWAEMLQNTPQWKNLCAGMVVPIMGKFEQVLTAECLRSLPPM